MKKGQMQREGHSPNIDIDTDFKNSPHTFPQRLEDVRYKKVRKQNKYFNIELKFWLNLAHH